MIYLIYEKKYIKFSLVYLLSIMVHYAAIISLFLLFLNRKLKTSTMLLILLTSILISSSGFVIYAMDLLNANNFLPEIVSRYMGTSSYSYDIGILNMKTLQQLFLLLFFIILIKKNDMIFGRGTEYANLIVNTYLLSTVLIILLSNYAIFAYRFAAHFGIVEGIFITYLIWFFKQSKLIVIMLSIMMLCLSYINYVVIEKVTKYVLFIGSSCDCLTTWCLKCH